MASFFIRRNSNVLARALTGSLLINIFRILFSNSHQQFFPILLTYIPHALINHNQAFSYDFFPFNYG